MDAETSTDPVALAERCAAAMYARDAASQALGITLAEVRPGYARMAMPVTASMANGAAVCHGGLLFSLADTAMAFASNSRNDVYVAISASIEFLSAGKLGTTMSAIATEVHRAGRTSTYSVAVNDSDGVAVAQFLGRVYRVRGNVLDGPAE